jgi:hypothetical protein
MIDYPRFHRNRTNLAIHIVMVPVFAASTVSAVWSLAGGHWLAAALLALGPVVSLATQGIGHRKEPNPPVPFAGPVDFLTRVLSEQFYRFPRFVLAGEWARAWRSAGRERRGGAEDLGA